MQLNELFGSIPETLSVRELRATIQVSFLSLIFDFELLQFEYETFCLFLQKMYKNFQ